MNNKKRPQAPHRCKKSALFQRNLSHSDIKPFTQPVESNHFSSPGKPGSLPRSQDKDSKPQVQDCKRTQPYLPSSTMVHTTLARPVKLLLPWRSLYHMNPPTIIRQRNSPRGGRDSLKKKIEKKNVRPKEMNHSNIPIRSNQTAVFILLQSPFPSQFSPM